MQIRLLPLLHELQSTTAIHGLWLIHSDEPLLIDWLIEACRPIWSNNNQHVKRLELNSSKSWYEVIQALSTLSLFDEKTTLIVTGKHKIDPKDSSIINTLNQFACDAQQGTNHNHLIWCLPKQDKKSLSHPCLKLFATQGMLIDGNLYDERLRSDFLHLKAKELKLSFEHSAWQALMSSTQGNLLSAYQTLWRLSFLSTGQIGIADLEQALVAGTEFNVFDLSNALLSADTKKILKILQHLKHTDTPPSVVLWAITKELRLLMQLQAGKSPSELGIWQNKHELYLQCAERTKNHSNHWSSQLYETDKAIKGFSTNNAWRELERLCLSI